MSHVLSKILQDSLDYSKLSRSQIFFASASSISLLIWIYNILKKRNGSSNKLKDEVECSYITKERAKAKMEPMGKILTQLKYIIGSIVGPKEYAYAIGIAFALVIRTVCDLWLIQNGTQIEAAIITADIPKLKNNIRDFMISMPTLALVNNGLKFCINHLRLGLRYRLSVMLYNKYIEGLTYYRLNMIDNECQNIDQLLTSDIEKFCNTISDVYTNIAKPILDIIVLVQRLSVTYTGVSTPSGMIAYLIVAGGILINARRPLTALTVKETQLEGQLRFVHSRIIANCEEIAFYQGNKREKLTLLNALDRLKNHLFNLSVFKFNIDYLDNIIARYLATVSGYLALSIPFLTGRYRNDSQAHRLETYYKSGRMMVKLSESIGRLVMAGRDFTRLAAYTTRVSQVLRSIEKNQKLTTNRLTLTDEVSGKTYFAASGIIELCDPNHPCISFKDVPLCTPNGEILVQSMSFTIKVGQNVIITGPNGSGKSSLFRLLGDLWPLYGGKIIKPLNNKLFYIPQRPYMALGTFRDQVIYPDSYSDMCEKGLTDEHLVECLKIVQLEYLLERESWNSVQDWQDVLSGGEKQRIALARLIYHKPLFAILDECTSAVSIDVEQSIYTYLCTQVKCSLLSVTHRVKQLQKFHSFVLRFDGVGGCSFELLQKDD